MIIETTSRLFSIESSKGRGEEMRELLNCPNCGAAITGVKCEYCGTLFYDFANMELYKPGYLRLKIADTLNILRVFPTSISIESKNSGVTALYADDVCVGQICKPPDYEIIITMQVMPDDRGVLLERLKKEEK